MDYFTIEDNKKQGTTSEILARLKKHFTVYSYFDDKEFDMQFPPPNKPTKRQFKKLVEADPKNANISADNFKGKGITLRERLLMEEQYFTETGKHLDVENITLCAGSRSADGRVPSVGWGPVYRGLCVGWSRTDDRGSYLRVRAAVTLDTFDLSPSLPDVLEINGVRYCKEA